ncbi:MAG: right-handed parallel beta-helix repeat-containing protein, partial [Thermoplasmata archaeon]
HDTYSGETVTVNGNVIINPGGHLDMSNSHLVLKCTSDGEFRIFVDNGGRLTMNGGSVSAFDSSYRYKFVINGAATLEGVTVTDTWGTGQAFDASTGNNPSLSNLKGGVQVYNDNVYIGNSTLTDGLLCMVYVGGGASPTIYGNYIHNVTYDVRAFRQVTTNPSSTSWSAMAFGIVLDASSATVENNDFADIGTFSTMAGVYYRDASTNTNDYYVIASGVAAKGTTIVAESNEVVNTGVLEKTTDSFDDGGNRVNQRFIRYRTAGVYGVDALGSNMKLNTLTTSGHGIFIAVTTAAAGGPLDFDIIIDNEIVGNEITGITFDITSVTRDCNINVSDNDMDNNGEGMTSSFDDSGLVVILTASTADVKLVMEQNNFRNNHARGAHVSAVSHSGSLEVRATNSNTFSGNNGAGLLVDLDTMSGAVKVLIDNSTFVSNSPVLTGDDGAIAIRGGSLTSTLDVKMADTTASSNTGSGVAIAMGDGMSVNLATNTKYTFINCAFTTNSQYGIYLYDNYGANAQRAVYVWKDIHASNNNQGVYVHSNSQLGNIDFRVDGLTANDNSETTVAVAIELAAASYNPKAILKDITINYAVGQAPSATGLRLQGFDENKRWNLDLLRADISQPGTALDAQFCEVSAMHSTLTGTGVNSIVARDSVVHLRYCDVPDLSAQTMGQTIDVYVRYYRWFNVSLIAWQNSEPIVNQTVSIKRFRDPQDEIYTASTDATGKLPSFMVPYWEVDNNNNPLRNDELQAFITVRGDNLNSLWFDFNDTTIGIEDPDVPELLINSPGEGTVQKAGTMVIQGEIRDNHSGIKHVEVTLDNVVWWPIQLKAVRIGTNKASFSHSISNLTDGVYTISVRGWDVARYPQENLSYQLVTIKDIKIDTQPPALQIVQPPTAYHVTNNKTFTIVGQTERSVNIRELTINDTPVSIFGTTFELTVRLHEGSNFFIVIAEDMAGNIAVTTREIILDTHAPTLIVSTPITGFSSNEEDFEVAGDTEQTAKVYVQLDNKPPQLAKKADSLTYRFYYVLNIDDEGTHTVTVTSEDVAGNTFSEVIYVRYDITPPVLEDIVPTRDPKPTNQQTVQVSGRTDLDVKQVSVNGLNFPVQEGYFAAEINLLEGPQTLTIHVRDQAGNENLTTRDILIDVTPPLLLDLTVSSTKAGGESWGLVDDLTINERSVRFRGRLAEEDIRDLYVQVGADNRSAIMDDPEALTFYRDFNLDEGQNILSFFAIDIAGNRLEIIYYLNVDPRAPTIEYYHPKMSGAMEARVDEGTVFISGKVSDVGTVTLFINNRQVLVHPNTGAFQTNVPLEEGLNNIPVEVTDKAGNKATDLLHITLEDEDTQGTSVGEVLGSLWWVFAIVAGLVII